jgi:hypothetical protein
LRGGTIPPAHCTRMSDSGAVLFVAVAALMVALAVIVS